MREAKRERISFGPTKLNLCRVANGERPQRYSVWERALETPSPEKVLTTRAWLRCEGLRLTTCRNVPTLKRIRGASAVASAPEGPWEGWQII